MTDQKKKTCPNCSSGNTYVLVSGEIVCRNCGFDQRKEMRTQMESTK